MDHISYPILFTMGHMHYHPYEGRFVREALASEVGEDKGLGPLRDLQSILWIVGSYSGWTEGCVGGLGIMLWLRS